MGIFSMPFTDGYELIRYAMDADVEDRLYLRWSIWYQSQMGFEEFKSDIWPQHQGQAEAGGQTAEDILKGIKGIIG